MLNDALYLNPSYGTFLPAYSMAFNYTWHDQAEIGKGRIYNVSIQDGQSPLFQAGVGFTQSENSSMFHFGASGKAIKKIGLGIGGKVILPTDGKSRVTEMTVASTTIPLEWLQAVVILDNALESREAIERGMYREITLGLKFNIQGLSMIYVDPHMVPNIPGGNTNGIEAGVEIPLGTDFYLRGGMYRNSNIPFAQTRGDGFGWGVGWVAPKVSMDYGTCKIQSPVGGYTHNLGMTMYF